MDNIMWLEPHNVRLQQNTAAIGGFALVSGLLSLLCHALLEPSASLSGRPFSWYIALAATMIVGAALLGTRRN